MWCCPTGFTISQWIASLCKICVAVLSINYISCFCFKFWIFSFEYSVFFLADKFTAQLFYRVEFVKLRCYASKLGSSSWLHKQQLLCTPFLILVVKSIWLFFPFSLILHLYIIMAFLLYSLCLKVLPFFVCHLYFFMLSFFGHTWNIKHKLLSRWLS